jgi:ribose 1,5-bisphosphokinase PhnN
MMEFLQRRAPVWLRKQYNHVVVVGASGSGKTSILRELRGLLPHHDFCIPPRFTARLPRSDDEPAENKTVSPDEFDQMKQDGRLALWWSKRLSDGARVHYGFGPTVAGPMPIYSCNDAIIIDSDTLGPEPKWISKSLVVQITVPWAQRKNRLLARNPELEARPEELKTRLRDLDDLVSQNAELVVLNACGKIHLATSALAEFLVRERRSGILSSDAQWFR